MAEPPTDESLTVKTLDGRELDFGVVDGVIGFGTPDHDGFSLSDEEARQLAHWLEVATRGKSA